VEIGILSFAGSSIHVGFKQVIADRGHKATELLVEGGGVNPATAVAVWKRACADAWEISDRADAILLPCWLPPTEQWLIKRLHERIADGMRLLVTGDPGALGWQNEFLAFYGMRFTDLAVGTGRPVERIACPVGPRIFDGIEAATVMSPTVVMLEPPAVPLLSVDDMPILDKSRDMFVDEGPEACTVMAVCHANNGGAVLSVGGSMFHDGYVGPTGVRFPGVGENTRLASNIVDFLLKQSAV
jgi:hypothetical protein